MRSAACSTSLPELLTGAGSHEALGRDAVEAPPGAAPDLPFGELLSRMAVAGFGLLPALAGEHWALAAPRVREAFRDSLVRRLARVLTRALAHDFGKFRAARQTDLERLIAGLIGQRTIYDQFLGEQRGGAALFERYPALARLAALTVRQWAETGAELLRRVAADGPELGRRLGDGRECGAIIALHPDLSDPHRGGRQVAILEFESGLRLVYKPRPLAVDRAWFRLLQWLNERAASPALRTLRLLCRPEHGWMEYVQWEACADEAAASRYYRRGGMLLCLTTLLDGTDLHAENVIAAGDQPVPIDLETLLHHPALPASAERSTGAAVFAGSVLTTGLLALSGLGSERTAPNLSGLGPDPQAARFEENWLPRGSDAMRRVLERRPPPAEGIPRLADGTSVLAADHVAELVAGFEHMYELLAEHRSALLASDGPIEPFRGVRVRHVFRSTRFYDSLLRGSLQPPVPRSDLDRSTYLEALRQPFLNGESGAPWQIAVAEQAALERGDIPYFCAWTDRCDVLLDDGTVLPAAFAEPSFPRVRRRLASLSRAECVAQTELLRAAFAQSGAPLP